MTKSIKSIKLAQDWNIANGNRDKVYVSNRFLSCWRIIGHEAVVNFNVCKPKVFPN